MPITTRVIVVPVIRDAGGAFLICRMPQGRGVYPGLWGLPGGGMEPGETMLDALRREVREELGLELVRADPLFFKEARHQKTYADGSVRLIHMIFLLFACRVQDATVRLNEEFDEFAWVVPADLAACALNEETRDTFRRLGVIS